MRAQTMRAVIAVSTLILPAAIVLGCHKQAAVRTDATVHRAVNMDTGRVVRTTDNGVLAAFSDTTPGAGVFSAGKTYRLRTSADRQAFRAAIREQHDLWLVAKPQDYRFLLRVGCFCPWPRGWQLIEVHNDRPTKAWDATGRSVSLTDWNTVSVDRLYEALERFAANDGEVHVAFEPRWHLPTYIRSSGGRMPDGWSIHEARSLRPLRASDQGNSRTGIGPNGELPITGVSDQNFAPDPERARRLNPAAPRASAAPRSRSLFNGRDLSGWHIDVPAADSNTRIRSPFVVRDAMLVSLGEPRGHLITDSSYRNYRLEVQYRFPGTPGNAGVLIHASTPRALYGMFPKSIEVQMESGNAGDFWCIVEDIRVPNMVRRRGPRAKWGITEGKARRILNLTDSSEKPVGQWNTMVVEAVGRSIRVWVNGDLVNDGSNATADHGQIALQSEGSEVEFRKLSLTPISRRAK